MDGRTFIAALALVLGLWIGFGFGLGPLLAGLAAGLLVLLVLFAAIGSRRGLSIVAMPEVTAVALDDPALPSEVKGEWRALEAAFADHGLLLAFARRSEPTPEGSEEFSACWNAPCGTFYVVSTIFYPPGEAASQHATTVATRTRDGVQIETTNRDDLPPLGRLEGFHLASFPGLGNKDLLAVHRKRLARLHPSLRSGDVLLPGGDAAGFSREVHSRWCDLMCRAGYLRPGQPAGYRPTLRGWAMWTAAYMWPILRLRQCMAWRRSHARLDEIAPAARRRVQSSHWIAAVAGVAGVTAAMSLPRALGVTCWTFLGIASAWGVQRRRGRPLGVEGILIGGAAGAAAGATVAGAPAVIFTIGGMPGNDLLSHAVSWVPPAGLYTLGAAALYWGWSGIPYLHSPPRKSRAVAKAQSSGGPDETARRRSDRSSPTGPSGNSEP